MTECCKVFADGAFPPKTCSQSQEHSTGSGVFAYSVCLILRIRVLGKGERRKQQSIYLERKIIWMDENKTKIEIVYKRTFKNH